MKTCSLFTDLEVMIMFTKSNHWTVFCTTSFEFNILLSYYFKFQS